MSKKEGKICFILQKHSKGTHMDYVYEMARTLGHDEGLPLTLFLEKGGCREEDRDWCVAQQFSFAPLRVLENFFMLLRMWKQGYTTFYIHYSFVSLISAGIVTKLFGGTVYYWNCGLPWNYKRGFFETLYEKFAYKCVDHLVTGVDAIVDGYVTTYGLVKENVRVIPNWIDLTKVAKDASVRQRVCEQLGIPENAPVLLFVHKLAKRKGADLLPAILEQVSQENAHFIVAGDGPDREEMEKEFHEKGLINRVHLVGFIGREEVQEMLQTADVFVMPSEEEGSPHSLIEAMAYDVPFVSFDVGGVKETAPPAAAPYIYTYPDTTAMAAGISELLADSSKYRSFQEAERTWVQNFSKPTIVAKFKALLTE